MQSHNKEIYIFYEILELLIYKQCVPGSLYQHNSLGPIIYGINYLLHRVEKSQSPGCSDVIVTNVFNQPFIIYLLCQLLLNEVSRSWVAMSTCTRVDFATHMATAEVYVNL